MFAIDPAVSKKICLLVPDDISVDEKKISAFIELAFFKPESPKSNIGKKVTFYPDMKINKLSIEKSDYLTYFHNDKIGDYLGAELKSFVAPQESAKENCIKFVKKYFGLPDLDPFHINYSINTRKKIIKVFTHPDALKIQLLSLFFVDDFKKELWQYKQIKKHAGFLCKTYKKLLLNTILSKEGIPLPGYKVNVTLKNTIYKLDLSVGYFLYMLQATELIKLKLKSAGNSDERKISISRNLKKYEPKIKDYIRIESKTKFEELGI
jgi:hypothetical protein